MCGRFALDAHTDELIQEYAAAGGDFRDWRPSYSIAPTNPVPIVRERVDADSGELRRTLDVTRWDFRPSFVDEKGKPNFNARIERLTTGGLWRAAFAGTRALVPMRGYFEWTGPIGDKQPHFLHDDAGKAHMLDLLTDESERRAGTIATHEVDRKVNYTRGVDPADASLIVSTS